jgi:hypothetical protein
MSSNVYTLRSNATLDELCVALEDRLRQIKSLATIRVQFPVCDELLDEGECECSYWTVIETLAIEAEEIRDAICSKVREQSAVESREIESDLRDVEEANIIS